MATCKIHSDRHVLVHVTLIAVLAMGAASPALAAIRLKDNDADNLNLASSWVGGVVPGSGDVATWSNNVAAANAVLLGGNLSFLGISILDPNGAVAIGGANSLTLGQSGIDMGRATQDLTITNASLIIALGDQIWNVTNSRTLTLSPATFARTGTATLNVQGGGTVATTTLTNGATGIIGTWASYGTGTSTRYATISGGTIVGYSGGVAAPTAAEVVDTSGMTNYDVAAVGTLGSGASFNTLRYTGSAGTMAGDFSANGLMNAGVGALTNSGNITIGANRELILTSPDTTRALTLSGTISDSAGGASGIIKAGAGTATLSGSNAYTGVTAVNRGVLRITNPDALGSTNGATEVYAGVPGTISGGQVQISGGITVAEPFILRGDQANYSGAIRSTGGSNILSGTLTIVNGSRINTESTSQLAIIGGVTGLNQQLVINSGNSVISFSEKPVLLGSSGGSFYTDQGGFTILAVTGNTWASTLSAGGTLRTDLPNALPTNSVLRLGVSYSTGGTVDLNGNSQTVGGLQSGTAAGGQTLPTGTRTVTSPTAATLTVNQANNTLYDGRLTGALGLTKGGAGMLTLLGTNTHTGTTTISGGRLNLANPLAMQNSTVDLQINSGAVFSNATSFVFGGLSGFGNLGLTNLTGSAVTLLAGNNGADTIYSGSMGGAGGLVKIGTGELDLTGIHSYSGATVVSNGLLSVNGRYTGAGQYTVASGGTLGGTGLIASAIQVLADGIAAPGNSIGTLTTSNTFDLDGILRIELENAAGSAGLSDLLDVNGFFDITNGVVQFVFTGTMTNDHYIFAEYDSISGSPFLDVQNLPAGYGIEYHYLDSNQIALVIPEPSSWILLALGFGLFALVRPRRRP
ncbi:MAG TPA: autotransporter-associated beta strand repeat-containing protein [Verrucomicrobiae bacterium]|nr:autotransporter-associated beta strand repeat-containing protein [Verrucomicrobiae bacterium]